jgi:hypothetical protein
MATVAARRLHVAKDAALHQDPAVEAMNAFELRLILPTADLER